MHGGNGAPWSAPSGQAAMSELLAIILALSSGQPEIVGRDAAYHIVAYDTAGESYTAGEGDTCADAWRGAILPDNVTQAICQSAR